jgi:hypothetical protein
MNFVDKHEHEDFSLFKNTAFLVRSVDEDGNTVVFVTTDLKHASTQGPYIVTMKKLPKSVVSTSCHLMSDSSKFDRRQMNDLALRFLDYNIVLLRVDTFGNVFANEEQNDRVNIARLVDPSYASSLPGDHWRKLKPMWYVLVQ